MPKGMGNQSEDNDMITADYDEVRLNDPNDFLHPYTHVDTFEKAGSAVIVKSEGVYVWDSNGNKYLDGIGGLWCVNIGHGRTEIAEVIAEQASQMRYYTHFGATTNIPASNLAKKNSRAGAWFLRSCFFQPKRIRSY